VVFGSPKNRQKGTLDKGLANEIAAEFLSQLIPVLKRNGVVLTLEPNAPAYGSDYLINYLDVVELSALVSSSQIKPQIDTGCLWMVGEEPLSAFKICTPHHIHISTPYLGEVPGSLNFLDIFKEIKTSDFSGWLVIEALNKTIEQSIAMAKWLQSEIRGEV
jgi:sugar phosphate isomerase/epimerase